MQSRARSCDRLKVAAGFLLKIRDRKFQIVTGFFDQLRDGDLTAVGQLPCGLTIDVPAEVWVATTVVVDTLGGGVGCDAGAMFTGVTVEPSLQAPQVPEAAELAAVAA